MNMDKCKYVIIDDNGWEMAIVFDCIIEHCRFQHHNVVSAGFCYLPDKLNTSVSTYGHSVSLGIESRKQDAAIIEQSLGINQG